MAVNAEKLIVDSIDLVSCFSPSTGELKWMVDQVTDGSIENGSETIYATGKSGVRLAALDRNKTASLSLNNGYMVGGVIAAQTGSEGVKATAEDPLIVPGYDIINMKAGTTTALLTKKPRGVVGAEVQYVYTLRNGAQDRKLVVASAAAKGESFTVDATQKKLTFAAGEFPVDTEIICFYDYETTEGTKYENTADMFATGGKIVADLTCRDVCDNDVIYHTKFVFPNARLDGNFTLQFGDSPAVHSLTAQALSSICSTSKTLWEWYIVD